MKENYLRSFKGMSLNYGAVSAWVLRKLRLCFGAVFQEIHLFVRLLNSKNRFFKESREYRNKSGFGLCLSDFGKGKVERKNPIQNGY